MLNEIILDKYRLEEQLKAAPPALIYRGVDVDDERAVVVAVLGGELVPSKEFLSRLEGVVEKLRVMDSPNAVPVLDYGELDNQAIVVQEFIRGQTLAEMLTDRAGLPVSLVLDIAQLVGEYLDVLHQVGVVHGSLEPQCIVLAADGNVKVLNAGLGHSSNIPELIAASKLETQSFYAPEVRLGGELTPRSDFYAMGATLYEALTGEPLEIDPESPYPGSWRTGLLPELDELVAKCLQADPVRRVQSAAEFLNGIEEVHRGMAAGAQDTKLGVEDALVGHTLGAYKLVERLGQGGMATVYKAYEPALDRYVAIKILRQFFAHDPEFMQRFRREAKAIAKLNHPNIVPIHGYGEEGDLAYIAMRHVEGGTLKQKREHVFGPERAVRLLLHIVRALAYAHQRGIVHRDIKPSNVLLSEGDWPLITDYGLAKMVEVTSQLTGSGVGMGTPMYMSPEQGQGADIDHRTDIYSAGIMLYEMLTGDVPFQADTPMAIVIKHISAPMPMPRQVNPDIPEVLERIILKATAKSPDDRYQTAEELVAALERSLSVLREIPKDISERRESPPREAAKPTEAKVQPPILDLDKGKRLEQNYIDGLSAYWIKNWTKAQAYFQAVIAEQPDYKDVADLLAEVDRHLKLDALYQQAQAAINNEEWPVARSALEELIVEDSGYENAADMLKEVNAKLRLTELYTQAGQLYMAMKWQAVVSVFERIEAIEPGYDPDELLPEAKRAHSEQELEMKLDELYRQALEAMNAGSWEQARQLLGQINREQPDFRDTAQLMERVAAETAGEIPPEQERVSWLRKVPIWGWALGGATVLVVLVVAIGSSTGLFGGKSIPEVAPTEVASQVETEVERGDPDTISGQEYYDLGVSLIDQGDYQGAFDAFEMALDQGLQTSELYTKMGWSLTRLDKNETAIAVYTKAIELDPLDEENWRERGWSNYALGNYESAIEDFDKAIEINPDDTSPYMGKALSYRGLEKPEEALQVYNRTLDLFPDDVQIINERGWLYFEDLEKYDLAISDFSRAIEIHYEGPHNYYFRGYVYQFLGRNDEARADFENALEITGGDPGFEFHTFVVEWLDEHSATGIADLDQMTAEELVESGWAYSQENDFESAIAAFDKALEFSTDDSSAWWGRACAYRDLGEYDAAIQDFNRAIELDPNNGWIYSDRGWLYYLQFGEVTLALNDFDKAIQVDPMNADHYLARGLIYQAVGKISEARADYENYMRITTDDPDADWRDRLEQWILDNPEDPGACVVPPSGLVSWWTGDGHARDVVGGNLAVLFNGAEYSQGMVGQAFFFPTPNLDGGDSFVEASSTPNLDDLEELTIETWVMLHSVPAFHIERFITIGIPGEKAVLRINGGPGIRDQFHFYMRINNELQHISGEEMPETGVFHHVAGTYDGSTMRLYLDGKEIGNLDISGDVATGESHIYMSSDGEPLDGVLDEMSIYDRALSQQEIQAIYEAGSAGKCKP